MTIDMNPNPYTTRIDFDKRIEEWRPFNGTYYIVNGRENDWKGGYKMRPIDGIGFTPDGRRTPQKMMYAPAMERGWGSYTGYNLRHRHWINLSYYRINDQVDEITTSQHNRGGMDLMIALSSFRKYHVLREVVGTDRHGDYKKFVATDKKPGLVTTIKIYMGKPFYVKDPEYEGGIQAIGMMTFQTKQK